MQIGKLELDSWIRKPSKKDGIGFHIDFQTKMVWIYLFPVIFYIYWRYDNNKISMMYFSDIYKIIKKVGIFYIIRHYQPCHRSGFFNLGLDYDTFFFWRYRITIKNKTTLL